MDTQDVLIKSIEKLVRMMQDLQTQLAGFEIRISEFDTRVSGLETQMSGVRSEIQVMKSDVSIALHGVNAADQLHTYMVDVSRQEAMEAALTPADIMNGHNDYNHRKNGFRNGSIRS